MKKKKKKPMKKTQGPKVLLLDIETAPILGNVWRLWQQDVGLNQVERDWFVLSWSAKWLGAPPSEVMYQDQRAAANIEDDSRILRGIWKLVDEADVLVTQNGVSFDIKKLNARFIYHGFQPPSPSKHIDTKLLAQKHFGFSSNKLEYMTDKLCTKYKKLKHTEFPGFDLWKECLAGNPRAWRVMEKYNKHDVLSLEELYTKLIPWDDGLNFNLYHDADVHVCKCGSEDLQKRGFHYTSAGKYQTYRCVGCGAWTRDPVNLFSKEKRRSLHRGVPR